MTVSKMPRSVAAAGCTRMLEAVARDPERPGASGPSSPTKVCTVTAAGEKLEAPVGVGWSVGVGASVGVAVSRGA